MWHDEYRFIRSRARSAFGNYSLPIRFNCLFELGAGGGFRGPHRPTCLAANTLSLGVLCGRRGTWAPCIYLVLYTCPIVLPLIGGLEPLTDSWQGWIKHVGALGPAWKGGPLSNSPYCIHHICLQHTILPWLNNRPIQYISQVFSIRYY